MIIGRQFVITISLLALVSCSGDGTDPSSAGICDPENTITQDIIGTWDAIYIDSIGNIVSPNYSVLTFGANGGYSWNASIQGPTWGLGVSGSPSTSPEGDGNTVSPLHYTFENSELTIFMGGLDSHLESNPAALVFCNDKSIMSYYDDADRRWVYEKH